MIVDSEHFWQVLMVIVQALIALAGFIGAMMIGRLIKAIDRLAAEDAVLHNRITEHREDMLANYVRNDKLESVRKDMIGRVDRFEISVSKMFTEAEGRQNAVMSGIRELIHTAMDRRGA